MKKTLILLLAAFMLLGFAACDTESTNDNSSADSVEASVDNSTESSAESEDSTEIVNENLSFEASFLKNVGMTIRPCKIVRSKDELLQLYPSADTNEHFPKYNVSFFDNKALLMVTISTNNMGYVFEVESVVRTSNKLTLTINTLEVGYLPALDEHPLIVEVDKASIDGCTEAEVIIIPHEDER